MPKYLIERNVAGAGKFSRGELQAASAKSNDVLRDLGSDVQWLHSYVTDDKIYCVYIAKNQELVQEHAKRSGFPADKIAEVKAVIDASTAEQR